jgi:hypothetical protein
MAKPTKTKPAQPRKTKASKTGKSGTSFKGSVLTPQVKALTFVREKKELGLADEDIRTILKSVHMPNASVSVRPGTTGISVGDRDPDDPVTGADPIGPGQDADPPFWRTDPDPTDPPRRPGF